MSAIGSANAALSHAQLLNEVDIRVARKTLDAAKQQGDAVVSMLQDAAAMAKGQSPQSIPGDQGRLYSLEPHMGNLIDTVA